MQIYNSTQRAAQLIKEISSPVSVEGIPLPDSKQDFDSRKDFPVYLVNFEGPENVHAQLFDDLYHKNELSRYEPLNYRIGAKSKEQADINEFMRLILYQNIELKDLLLMASMEELEKAVTKSLVYSGIAPLEFFHFYLYAQKYAFPKEAWSRLSGDWERALAPKDPSLASKILEECLLVHEKGFTKSKAFPDGTYLFRRSIDDLWSFERFIRQVNGPQSAGNVKFKKPFGYKKYSTSEPNIKKSGFTTNDFPGPGIILHGLHSLLFPKDHLSSRFLYALPLDASGYEETLAKYRAEIVLGEDKVKDTTFASFRGLILVSNPWMKVRGKQYGLLILNDHFENTALKTALLVQIDLINDFLSNPLAKFGKEHIFHPSKFGFNERLNGKYINLVTIASSAGLCEELPEYNHIALDSSEKLSTHDEIKKAALFGFAQLDILREAYRLYSLGYYFDAKKKKFYLDEYRLLKELIRWNKSGIEDTKLPVAFPFSFLDHGIRPNQVRNVGFVGANLVVYKNNPKGDSLLFETVPEISSEGFDSNINEDLCNLLGVEENNYWLDFRGNAEYYGVNPLIVAPAYKEIGKGILSQLYSS